ncbi:MAG: hypothetical protein P8M80_03655 [Pirellulaceae bacterium]|nr:hypothetical protein [Pirellulaceae bacterium]
MAIRRRWRRSRQHQLVEMRQDSIIGSLFLYKEDADTETIVLQEELPRWKSFAKNSSLPAAVACCALG